MAVYDAKTGWFGLRDSRKEFPTLPHGKYPWELTIDEFCALPAENKKWVWDQWFFDDKFGLRMFLDRHSDSRGELNKESKRLFDEVSYRKMIEKARANGLIVARQ